MTYTLAFLSLFALPFATDVTGKWSGTFQVQNDQGEHRSEPILMIFKQDGSKLSGSGGPNETERHSIENGKIEGDKLSFEVSAKNFTIYFDLILIGDEIKGEMKRKRGDREQTARVVLKRLAEK